MKHWFVVQVYAGYEQAVKLDIEKRIQEQSLEDYFGGVLIPSAKMKHFFETSDVENQQLFPGYVLIEMEMIPEAMRLVTSSPRVMRFLGGTQPVPLKQKEIARILSQMESEISIGVDKEEFTIGNEVEIKEGLFAGFVGIIDRVDKENKKLTVLVSIFGRMTPVDVGFNQVTR